MLYGYLYIQNFSVKGIFLQTSFIMSKTYTCPNIRKRYRQTMINANNHRKITAMKPYVINCIALSKTNLQNTQVIYIAFADIKGCDFNDRNKAKSYLSTEF